MKKTTEKTQPTTEQPEQPRRRMSARAIAAENRAIQEEAKRLAKVAKLVEGFVSTNETRKSLMAPYHDKRGGVVVATDGKALIATKHGFNPDIPDRDFPRWRQVVPLYKSDDVQTVKVNPSEVAAMCDKGLRLARAIDSKIDVCAAIPLPDGKRVVLDAAILCKVAKVMDADDITEIKAVDGVHPILAKNATTTLVAMPIRDWDRKNHCHAHVELKPGRGTYEHTIMLDALTGRVVSAPKRSDDGAKSRAYADALREGVERKKRDGAPLPEIKKDVAEIARIEKRIAAEDEIDALMGATPAPAAPAETPAAAPVDDPQPEAAKHQRKASKPRKAATPEPQPEAPAAVQPSAWSDHTAEWRDMTTRNLHDEVRIAMSEWAAVNAPSVPEFAMIAADFHMIAAREDGDGYEVEHYMEWRNDTTDEMLERIGAAFGSEAKAGIAKCL